MDTTRVPGRFRLAPLVEWLVAFAFLFATISVATLVVRELQGQERPQPAPVAPAVKPLVTSVPAAIPARAVSVPVLPFLDGKEVRVGDTAATVAGRLGRSAEMGRQEIDRGALGERLTRFYEYAGTKFILVFEPFEQHGEARVSAIYLP